MLHHYVPRPAALYQLDKSSRLVWNALCVFARWNGDKTVGQCFPSMERLAHEAGVCLKTTRKGIRNLMQAGLLRSYREFYGIRVAATYYTLLPGADTGKSAPSIRENVPADTGKSTLLIRENVPGNSINITVLENRDSPSPDFRGSAPRPAEGSSTLSCRGLTPQTPISGASGQPPAHDALSSAQADGLFDFFWAEFRRFNPAGKAEARAAFARLFPIGLPLDAARDRENRLVALLNDLAPAWEANLAAGKGRFNPRMGRWLDQQELAA